MEDTNNNAENENLDFYEEIISSYDKILNEIDFLVEGSIHFQEPKDPRTIKITQFLNNLKNNMNQMIQKSKEGYFFEREVEERLEKIPFEAVCDKCGSKVDSRVGIMKWHDDEKPATPEDWNLLEKFNDFLGIPVRWVTYCTNLDCQKIWKEGMFEKEISEPKIKIIKDKIRNNIKRERGNI